MAKSVQERLARRLALDELIESELHETLQSNLQCTYEVFDTMCKALGADPSDRGAPSRGTNSLRRANAAALAGVPDRTRIPDSEAPMAPVDRSAELLMGDLCRSEATPAHLEGGEITLQGTCKTFAIPSMFEFLGRTRRTGTLRVRTNDETLEFEFVRGDIVFSNTDNPPHGQRLGEILVTLGYVSRERLESFLSGISGERIGKALESEELVRLDDLHMALEHQIQNRLKRAFEATESAFTFVEGGPESADQRVKLSVTQLLLERLR